MTDYHLKPNTILNTRHNSIDSSILCNSCNYDNNNNNIIDNKDDIPLYYSPITNYQQNIKNIPTLYELIHQPHNINEEENEISITNFSNYLKSIHCQENLHFILEINQFLSIITNASTSTNSLIIEKWSILYYKYFNSNSDYEINLPHKITSKLNENEIPTLQILKICKTHIINEILSNLYHKYVKNHHHNKFCNNNHNNIDYQNSLLIRRNSEQTSSITSRNNNTITNNSNFKNPTVKRSNTTLPTKNIKTPITPPISPPPLQQSSHYTTTTTTSTTTTTTKMGYDYYTIPSNSSTTSNLTQLDQLDQINSNNSSSSILEDLNNSPRTTRNNSTSSNTSSIGSSINNIMDNSITYLSKMKKFKFRRFSNE
ncbi:hypothetical protein KGF54_002077 [Candida jiufengensis]|uniref:uncharacterized protein n=1 Tax=Candida jiufengensis TaxID=497108 RepID=UPI00222565F5|nr:uncharacterized protein KGF54_002077 [Candida jiufengensis]KAI5954302.1 hypothetical protein KGF54_002077 [Candida jiufengensis]